MSGRLTGYGQELFAQTLASGDYPGEGFPTSPKGAITHGYCLEEPSWIGDHTPDEVLQSLTNCTTSFRAKYGTSLEIRRKCTKKGLITRLIANGHVIKDLKPFFRDLKRWAADVGARDPRNSPLSRHLALV